MSRRSHNDKTFTSLDITGGRDIDQTPDVHVAGGVIIDKCLLVRGCFQATDAVILGNVVFDTTDLQVQGTLTVDGDIVVSGNIIGGGGGGGGGGGVTTFSAGTTGFSPTTASTGPIVLSGTLRASNGGTGITAPPTNGQLLIGNGTDFTLSTITPGTGLSVVNSTGSITITNTGVTSFSAGTTGFSPTTASTGAVVLSGILNAANGGTGNSTNTSSSTINVGITDTSAISTYYPVLSPTSGSGDKALEINSASLRYNVTAGDTSLVIGDSVTIGTSGGDASGIATGSIAIGTFAGTGTSVATNNIMIGSASGNTTMTGGNNVAVGTGVLQNNISGTQNTGVGRSALTSLTTGSENTAFGRSAGSSIVSGSNNTFVGSNSNSSNTSIANVVVVGQGSTTTSSGDTIVGQGITSLADDAVIIGRGASLGANGASSILIGQGTTSDVASSIAIGQGATVSSASRALALTINAASYTAASGIACLINGASEIISLGGAPVLDNLATAPRFPTAPQTEGIWYGRGTKAASSSTSVLIGNGAVQSIPGYGNNVVIGSNAFANLSSQNVAIGLGATASGGNAVAIGTGANCATEGVAIGQGAVAGLISVAVGREALCFASDSVSIGFQSAVTAGGSLAFGRGAQALAGNCTVIGTLASCNVAAGIALGPNASVFGAANAFGIVINGASVNTFKYGMTINGAPRQVQAYGDVYVQIPTSGGTTQFSTTSSKTTYFTGTSTQTVGLPVITQLSQGHTYTMINASTGPITVNRNAITTSTGIQAVTLAPFTLNVANTTTFPTTGTINVALDNLTTAVVNYTGKTATSFTGATSTAVIGNTANGGGVSGAFFLHQVPPMAQMDFMMRDSTGVLSEFGWYVTSAGGPVITSEGEESIRALAPTTGGFTHRSVKTTDNTASSTLTAAAALGGYFEASFAGAITITLDTGANLDANPQLAANLYVGQSFECKVVSSDPAGVITYAGASGITLKGTLARPTHNGDTLLFYRTGAATWDVVIC